MSNIFEIASREKFRFDSVKGSLTTEQLWDLPLSKPGTRFDLNSVAHTVNDELKAVTEDSFVASKPSVLKNMITAKLDVVKHIIAVKQDEAEKAKTRAANTAKRAKLLEVLASKEDESLKGMSREEILAQIEALEA